MTTPNVFDEVTAQAAPSSPIPQEELPVSNSPIRVVDPGVLTSEVSEPEVGQASSPAAESPSESHEPQETTVRVAKDSQLRKMITFVMAKVDNGSTVTIQALNKCVHKAITLASIVRDRLGNVHQINSLLVVQEASNSDETQGNDKVRTTSGIQIILSKQMLS